MNTKLSYIRRLFKRRKHQRFPVREGTSLVIMAPGKHGEEVQRQVIVIDISMGGTAFLYEGSPADLESFGVIKLSASTPHTESIHFETISDIPVPTTETTSEPYRRRGVKFTWMGFLGESYIKSFIEKYGIQRRKV